jgi:hypothetical protein
MPLQPAAAAAAAAAAVEAPYYHHVQRSVQGCDIPDQLWWMNSHADLLARVLFLQLR